MADLTQVLLAACSPGPDRQQAEQTLSAWEGRNAGELAQALSVELVTENKPMETRQLAALFLKNMVSGQDKAIKLQKMARWQELDAGVKQNIKQNLLATLRSPVAGHIAAVTASEFAAIEIPYNAWPEFLASIFENVSHPEISEACKVASLETLGYTCERVGELDDSPQIDSTTTDRMLTTIVEGAQPAKSELIRLKAIQALRNSLMFASKNMEQKRERDAILNTICEASRAQSAEVRGVAYECLGQIAQYYYDKLQDYMTTIFQLTTNTIRNEEDEVAKWAVEFWSTLSEIEQELLDEAAEAAERNLPIDRPCHRYVAAAMDHLVPLLLEFTLTKQDEDLEQDEYNLHHAGQLCLSFIALTVEDAVVPVVMPFVTKHIQSENWRYRDAAIMAFTSVLDGPSSEVIGPYAHQAIPLLLNALNDPHPVIQDTSAHCIGRICLLHVRAVPPDVFPTLVQGMVAKLAEGVPNGIARQACTAINNLATAFSEENATTSALSQYTPLLLQSLLQCADRASDDGGKLREAAITSMSGLISGSAEDVKPVLAELLPAIIQRLSQANNMQELVAEDRESKGNMQSLCCAVIQVLCQKLDKEVVQPLADNIMNNLLHILQTRTASSHDEALLVVSAIADKLEGDFANYMPTLQPYLVASLRNFEAFHLCKTAVATVGDISRAIEGRMTPFCVDIMTALIEALRDPTVDRTVKPPVIQCFGEIAMAIGGAYESYLNFSIMLLMQASGTAADESDEDMIDYVNQLRETILEAYTGIFQGLRDGNLLHLLVPYLPGVLQFLEVLANDPNRDEIVLGRAVGLIGDISQMMGPHIRSELTKDYVKQLIQDAMESGDESMIDTARWAMGVVHQALQAN